MKHSDNEKVSTFSPDQKATSFFTFVSKLVQKLFVPPIDAPNVTKPCLIKEVSFRDNQTDSQPPIGWTFGTLTITVPHTTVLKHLQPMASVINATITDSKDGVRVQLQVLAKEAESKIQNTIFHNNTSVSSLS